MVWGLFPADPLSGEEKYYIFTKGNFKVGRKGCEIVVKGDKGVSRVHAEIIVSSMTAMSPGKTKSSKVKVQDLSKYGTFINKNLESEEKVHAKESTLSDGDLICFGTGKAVYRFSFIPLVFLVLSSGSSQLGSSFIEKLSLIGASKVDQLDQDCTHVVVDQHMEVNGSILDAIAAKKPLVMGNWIESIAEKSIRNEIPSCTDYLPSLSLEGGSIKVVDPMTRETCLEGYTFVLEPVGKYKFGHELQMLLGIAGGKGLPVDQFSSTSQDLEDVDSNRVAYVVPEESQSTCSSKISLPRIIEKDLLRAILCGHLHLSLLRAPPAVVSSSCSTDETIVADSDVEEETSRPIARHVVDTPELLHEVDTVLMKEETLANNAALKSENSYSISEKVVSSGNNDGFVIRTSGKTDESNERSSSSIIYTQLEDTITPARSHYSAATAAEVNFKCFRKRPTPSGNSFNNIVPFSRLPYDDLEFRNEDAEEFKKEEKRRKQLEAMREDLFNNEMGRKRGFSGSIRGILSRDR